MSKEKKEEVVAVVNEPGSKMQWGKNLLYRKEGGKDVLNQKKFVILSSVFLGLGITFSLIFDNSGSQVFEISAIRLRVDFTSTPSISFPIYTKEEDRKISDQKNVAVATQTTGDEESQKKTRPGIGIILRSSGKKIPPGTYGVAVLLSGASNQFVRAELTDAVKVAGETLIPQGAVLVGQGTSSEERLYINFKQAVLRDGSAIAIDAKACDMDDQVVGVKGNQVGNKTLKLGAAIALNFASGLSQGLQETEVKGGVAVRKADPKNALLNGASSAALEESKNLMTDIRSDNEIEVAVGEKICVLFAGGD